MADHMANKTSQTVITREVACAPEDSKGLQDVASHSPVKLDSSSSTGNCRPADQ